MKFVDALFSPIWISGYSLFFLFCLCVSTGQARVLFDAKKFEEIQRYLIIGVSSLIANFVVGVVAWFSVRYLEDSIKDEQDILKARFYLMLSSGVVNLAGFSLMLLFHTTCIPPEDFFFALAICLITIIVTIYPISRKTPLCHIEYEYHAKGYAIIIFLHICFIFILSLFSKNGETAVITGAVHALYVMFFCKATVDLYVVHKGGVGLGERSVNQSPAIFTITD